MNAAEGLVAEMIESGRNACTRRSRSWLNMQVADTIATLQAENERLRESERRLLQDLQAHKDALAQSEPKP